MATDRVRTTRKLKPWMVQQVESGKFPGLVWDDDQKTSFRIPWKHAGKQDFRHDEDAAIFKAWAVYKNKLRPGDKLDAAVWKTRLRCALNKSPEFQEVPDRSQLDISEPYKVYRIVPPGEQVIPASGKSGRKRKIAQSRDSSSDEEEKGDVKKPQLDSLLLMVFQELPSIIGAGVSSSVSPEDSGIGSDTSNTDSVNPGQTSLESLTCPPTLPYQISHTDLQVTVLYSGVEVSRCLVRSGECKLSAGAPPVRMGGEMEHVLLPDPDQRLDDETHAKTNRLLKFLQAGVMLASNMDGIFAQRQRSCAGRVFWTGPCAYGGEPNKLERHAHVKLFDTQSFLKELERYRTHGGMLPNYQVTLCFGEEISECDPATNKLITAQIEQVIAAELVREASQTLLGQQSSDLLLQDPPAPYVSPLTPLNMQGSCH
ncbi:interferon regulatory factor 9 [Rhinophrynus dorsalis]